MSADDTLGLLAEIAIAIAGFSSVVVAFGDRSAGRWSSADRIRLSVLVVGSLGVAFFAFLPGVIRLVHGSEAFAWGFSSAVLGTLVVLWQASLYRGTRTQIETERSLNPWIATVTALLYLICVVLQGMNVVGPFDREPGPFVLGLLLCLLNSAWQFVRLVFTRLEGPR